MAAGPDVIRLDTLWGAVTHRAGGPDRPVVVLLHGPWVALVGRLRIRGGQPTVVLYDRWPFMTVPRALRPLVMTWERWAARWTNLAVLPSAAAAEEGVAGRVWVPPVVCRPGESSPMVLRAHAFGHPATGIRLPMEDIDHDHY